MATMKSREGLYGAMPKLSSAAVNLIPAIGAGAEPEELEKIVRTDPAIAAMVLSRGNSVACAGADSEQQFSLAECIMRFGSNELFRMVTALAASDVLKDGGEMYGLEDSELRDGAICGGVAAEWIAMETGLEDPGLCFVSGLVRDIGKLVLDHLDADLLSADAMAQPGVEEVRPQLELEREILELSHAEFGAELAETWGMPQRICDAIRYHHEPSEGDGRDVLQDIVHAAEVITSCIGVGVGVDGLRYPQSESAFARLGIGAEQLSSYMVDVRNRYLETLEKMG